MFRSPSLELHVSVDIRPSFSNDDKVGRGD